MATSERLKKFVYLIMASTKSRYHSFKKNVEIFILKVEKDVLFDRASALAFQIVFSFIPTLAIAYAVFGWLGGFEHLSHAISDWMVQYLAPSFSDQARRYLHSIERRVSPDAIGVFGVLGFLYSVVALISQVERSLNAIWETTHRPHHKRVLLHLLAIFLFPLVLGASLAATSAFATFVISHVKTFFSLTSLPLKTLVFLFTLVPMILTGTFIAMAYYTLPYAKVSLKAAFKAGWLTGFALEGLKILYALYASFAFKKSVYGALALLPILFLWISLGANVFLFGAELCYFMDRGKRKNSGEVSL